jgi:hypothetical protein
MASNYQEWNFNLWDQRLQRPVSDSTGTVQILTQGTFTKATIYADGVGTTATNPMTLSNGQVRFWTDFSVTTLDVSFITAGGDAVFLKNVTPSNHRVVIDPDKIMQTAIVGWIAAASAVITDTGMKLTTAMRVRDCFVRVTSPVSGTSIDVGTTTGSVTGFAVGVTTEVIGWKLQNEGVSAAASGGWGSLLLNANTATLMNDRKFHVPANATSGCSIIYQLEATAGTAGGGGYIFLVYDKLPVG